MPKIPSQSRAEAYRKSLYEMQEKKRRPMSWVTVLYTFLLFSLLAAVAMLQQQWVLWWVVIGVGNTVIFFQILFLVIRAATRKE